MTFINSLLSRGIATGCLSVILALSAKAQEIRSIDKSVYDNVPFEMEQVKTVSFPDYKVNIKDFGAVADGTTLCTEAINKAIRDVNKHGGGVVVIPTGMWLTGPIEMLSNVNLYTEQNAMVLFTGDHTKYEVVETIFEGIKTFRCQSPIFAKDAENIAITGKGIFDGNGWTWRAIKKSKLTESEWKKIKARKYGYIQDDRQWFPSEASYKGYKMCTNFNNPDGLKTKAEWEAIRDWLRPVLVDFVGCKRVLFQDATFRNSPSWCLHPMMCQDVILNNVTVYNPWNAQNGDALDLESCDRALILNSTFDAGDDAICIKSGKDAEGRKRNAPCKNVIAKNNTVYHGHGGFVVGSEMSGGAYNILIENSTFIGTDIGLRFKSTRGRGGVVKNIYCRNINMFEIAGENIIFNLYYGGKDPLSAGNGETTNEAIPEVNEGTPCFRDIYISNIICHGGNRAFFFNGLPEMPINNINLDNVKIIDAQRSAEICQGENISINNVTVTTKDGSPAIKIKNATNVKVNGKNIKKIDSKGKEL